MKLKDLFGTLCQTCYDDLEQYVEADSIGIPGDIDPMPALDPCDLCGSELTGDTYYEVKSARVSDALADEIGKRIYGCEHEGLEKAAGLDDDEAGPGGTNERVLDLFAAIVEELPERTRYEKFLGRIANYGELECLAFPQIECRRCGERLEGWFDDVKTKTFRRIIPYIPTLPAEMKGLPIAAGNAAHEIEYYRSDCSNYLVHLTKPAELVSYASNVDSEVQTTPCTAQQVLFLILAGRRLKAFKGRGLHAPAVCFTEKTLTALKDTLVGPESDVRKRRSSLSWEPYGLMLPKEYLRGLGVAPALHLSAAEESSLPLALKHRVVPFSNSSNWNHEREWRGGVDIDFDPTQVTVLVPRFEQIAPFERALRDRNIQVKGFLPLLDVFACI